jgi:hypothetical protein
LSIIVQKDATINSLFIFVNCTTCFGWQLHPSSGVHINVSAVSGIIETVLLPVLNVTGWEQTFKTGSTKKGKAVPLQAWSGPEGSRKLRIPVFLTTAQDGGKVGNLTHRPHLLPRKYSWYSFLLEAVSTPGP